jgi:hypothetical protein
MRRCVLFIVILFCAVRGQLAGLVELGAAGNYVILAKAGVTTVPASVITGNIGVSPIAATAMTGFSFGLSGDGTFSISTQVIGKAYGASYAAPTPGHLLTAVGDMAIAYGDVVGREAGTMNLGGGEIGGLTLSAGVYTFVSGVSVGVSGLIFDGGGDDNAIFIIQMTGSLVIGANMQVLLRDGANARNIFWQVSGSMMAMAGAHVEGILLVATSVTFVTGSSLNGRIFAHTACILQQARITEPPSVAIFKKNYPISECCKA